MGHHQPHKKCIIDGITFASHAEGRRYEELKALKRSGIIKDFEIQPRYQLLSAFRKCPKCGHNQGHIPKTSKKAVTMCHECGTLTDVIQGMEYVADFKLIYPDGTEKIEDVKGCKGFLDPVFVLKRKLFNHFYPGKQIVIVVMPPVRKKKANPVSMPTQRMKPCRA